jgi:hypothetical protein
MVCERDLVWHEASPDGSGSESAMVRRLSADEETGARASKARFDAAWHRPAGYHDADTEWYVLAGTLTAGPTPLGPGGYLRAPAGLLVPPLAAAPGTEVLVFSDHGPAGFTASDRSRPGYLRRSRTDSSGLAGQLTVCSAAGLDWTATPWEVTGPGQPASRIKALYREPPLSAGSAPEPVTALWEAPPGWADDSAWHRATAVEAFVLAGRLEYSYGVLTAGSYVFRPPRIQAARARVTGAEAALVLVRLGDTAPAWRTARPYVRVSGRAVNYDATDPAEALIPSGFSVTSASADAWAARQRAVMADPGAPAPSGVSVSRLHAAAGR